MFQHKADRDWEKFGQIDPYFGVLSRNQYRLDNLTYDARNTFFQTGQEHVNHILKFIHQHIDMNFMPMRILDFGCGVGRMIIPFSKIAESVTGLDVSESMLAEARKNCNHIPNVQLLKADDHLSQLSGKFDMIHSFIVFQHIPPKRGELIFSRLLEHLEISGVIAVHFVYEMEFELFEKLLCFLRYKFPPIEYMQNLFKGRNISSPQMQMHPYNLNKLLSIIQNHGGNPSFVEYMNTSDDQKAHGLILYFKKHHQSA